MASLNNQEQSVVFERQFLQGVLREIENDSSLLVVKCSTLSGVSDGAGYLSSMTRVEADVVKKGKKEKVFLIVKTLPTDETPKEYVSGISAFPTEIKIFSEILPKVSELLLSVGKPHQIGAKFYYCKNTLPYMLVVEDLCASGFKMADKRKGLDLDHCLLVMKTLGRYHASNIVLHDSDLNLVEQFERNFFSDPACDAFCENMAFFGVKSASSVADKLFPNGENYSERLMKRAKTLRRDYRNLLNLNRSNLNVLLHGDLWVNNMMFRYNESDGKVEDVKFVDFQFGMYGSLGIDLNYFLNSSLAEEVRLNHVNDLLKAYHSELSGTLALLGYKGEVSFQDVLNEYLKMGSYGFMVGIVILQLFKADADDDFDFTRIANDDNVEPGFYKRATNPLFMSMLKILLPDFDKMGLF